MRVLLTAAAAAAFMVPMTAQALVTETFEGFDPGTAITAPNNEILGGRATIGSPTNELRVYPTDGSGGRDGDLEYPVGQGNALILQSRPGRAPNDDANGGTLTIDFAQPTDLVEITLFDFERGEFVEFYNGAVGGANLIGRVDGTAREFSNNAQTDAATVTVAFAALANAGLAQGITQLTILTDASTAFDDLVVTPIPGAAVLLGTALAGLAWRRRQRA
ncbi:MAG: hypothetical protein AAFX81_09365 [Pseudomonadota bacterium]